METCVACRQEIKPDEPAKLLSAELGGGVIHEACWNMLLPWARKLIREVPYQGRA